MTLLISIGRSSLRNLEEIHVLQRHNLRQVLHASFKIQEYYFCCFVPLSNSRHFTAKCQIPYLFNFIYIHGVFGQVIRNSTNVHLLFRAHTFFCEM
jgi:hypothetical protein